MVIKLNQYFFVLIGIFYINLVIANTYTEINYKLEPSLTGNIASLKVEAEIKGELSKEVVLAFPDHWAGMEYFKQIKNIELKYPKEEITREGNKITLVNASKSNRVVFSYEIHQKHGNPSNVHEAIIRQDLIHVPGYGLFAIPEDLGNSHNVRFNVRWKNIPGGWRTLSDYGLGKSLRFIGSQPDLSHAIYVAGNLRVYQIGNSKNSVYLSLYGSFDVADRLIASDLGGIIKTQRSFFNGNNFPYYAISLIEGNDPYFTGGTGFNHSFTAYFPRGIERKHYYILFAHEHCHTWIGNKIASGEQEELNYWWTEGFTDYYSRVLALRSGGISLKDFVNECDQILRDYYLSPVLNEPNERIKQDFWKNHDIEKLPYYRGFIFAIYLNQLIKQQNPNYSIDNVMWDLFKDNKKQGFSRKHFQEIVRKYVSQGVELELIKFIDKGETIWLDNLKKSLPLEKNKVGNYELGFDKDALVNKRVMMGVNTDSPAYHAGLRNGDKVIGYHIIHNDNPRQMLTIQTINKTYIFKPESQNKKDGYQFKANLSKKDQAEIKDFFGARRSICVDSSPKLAY